jgi:hypothetical protein
MTKLLNIDEMLDVLSIMQHPAFSTMKSAVGRIADEIGETIAESLGVECGSASYEGSAFAGTCVAFFAKAPGQPCPEVLRDFDESEWCCSEYDLDPETGKILQPDPD